MRIFIFLVYFPIFFKFELSLINLGYFPSNQNRLRSIQPGMSYGGDRSKHTCSHYSLFHQLRIIQMTYYASKMKNLELYHSECTNSQKFQLHKALWGSGSRVHLTALSLCLALCKHLFIISDFLLSIVRGSPLRMSSFSERQRSHFLVPHLYGKACLCRVHLTSKGLFFSLRSQIYLARLVLFFLRGSLKDDRWFPSLDFHLGS